MEKRKPKVTPDEVIETCLGPLRIEITVLDIVQWFGVSRPTARRALNDAKWLGRMRVTAWRRAPSGEGFPRAYYGLTQYPHQPDEPLPSGGLPVVRGRPRPPKHEAIRVDEAKHDIGIIPAHAQLARERAQLGPWAI